MTKRKIANPFVYQGYVGPDYFCDRVVETEQLCSDLQNGRNIASFPYGCDGRLYCNYYCAQSLFSLFVLVHVKVRVKVNS